MSWESNKNKFEKDRKINKEKEREKKWGNPLVSLDFDRLFNISISRKERDTNSYKEQANALNTFFLQKLLSFGNEFIFSI